MPSCRRATQNTNDIPYDAWPVEQPGKGPEEYN